MRIVFVLLAVTNALIAFFGMIENNGAILVWAIFGVMLSLLGFIFEGGE